MAKSKKKNETSIEFDVMAKVEDISKNLHQYGKDIFSELFKHNMFNEMFALSDHIQINCDNPTKKDFIPKFYKVITQNSVERLATEKSISSFLEELEIFLNNENYNDSEKKSFLNSQETILICHALNTEMYGCARLINKYRKNKEIAQLSKYLANKIKQADYTAIDKILELSSSISTNNSGLLRHFYQYNFRDYNYMKELINKYELDINGLGTIGITSTYGEHDKYTFAHMVCEGEGTQTTSFFNSFIKDFGNQLNFDIQAIKGADTRFPKRLNILEILLQSELEPSNQLSRIQTILENCNLSEKHIGFIANALISKDYDFFANNYDHPVYEALFSHEKFNSNLFDREAFLNSLVLLDNCSSLDDVREELNYTVNPTSILFNKFSKLAKPAISLHKHPFVTWLEEQTNDFSIDTLKTLINYYRDDIESLNIHEIKVPTELKTSLQENGIFYPEKDNFMSFFFKRLGSKPKTVSQHPIIVNEVFPKTIKKIEFNETLLSQVKEVDIQKYVNAIKLNHDQYQSVAHGGIMQDNEHYMCNLLPKFLNTTIENYLYFSTFDEKEAKENAIVQLKILNKKTFEALTEELNREHEKIAHKTAVQKKIIQQY